jgi:hypothetical protein
MLTKEKLDSLYQSVVETTIEVGEIHVGSFDDNTSVGELTRLLCTLTSQQTSLLHGIYSELVFARRRAASEGQPKFGG